ncbi:MAG: hypothetical protein U5K75_06745 [Ahrensia sp.]|nr:hypothetical protein [Ahrensia sp.]
MLKIRKNMVLKKSSWRSGLLSHLSACALALTYAWLISQSDYVRTGLQFIAPVIIILFVHLTWMAAFDRLQPGFSSDLFRQTTQSAVWMCLLITGYSIIAPMPSKAAGDSFEGLLVVLICLAMLSAVIAILTLIIRYGFKLARYVYSSLKKTPDGSDGGNDTRLFDFGSLGVAFLLLGISSLEGLPNTYSFAASNRSVASTFIPKSPDVVWQTLQTATSPQFLLPQALRYFPQPVEVTIDEGTALGALRKVKMSGREGTGYLTLQVTQRNENHVRFDVLSDTSPYAQWIAYKSLTYEVIPMGTVTQLNVSLEYERLLSPAWFFNYAMKGAAYLAMGVLADDVKARAQSPDA